MKCSRFCPLAQHIGTGASALEAGDMLMYELGQGQGQGPDQGQGRIDIGSGSGSYDR